jgi:hypothetical protein
MVFWKLFYIAWGCTSFIVLLADLDKTMAVPVHIVSIAPRCVALQDQAHLHLHRPFVDDALKGLHSSWGIVDHCTSFQTIALIILLRFIYINHPPSYSLAQEKSAPEKLWMDEI